MFLALAGGFFTTSSLIVLIGHNWQINIDTLLLSIWASPVPQIVKNLPAMRKTLHGSTPQDQSLGWEDPLKNWQATPAFLPGESPWTEELGGL